MIKMAIIIPTTSIISIIALVGNVLLKATPTMKTKKHFEQKPRAMLWARQSLNGL